MQDPKNVTIVIEQLNQSRRVNAKQFWDVRVWIFVQAEGEEPIDSWGAQISDPFIHSQHEDVSFYLNKSLAVKNLTKHKDLMSSIPTWMSSYQACLMQQLRFNERLPMISSAACFANKEIKIEILTKKGFLSSARAGATSLQFIHWELLENADLWMNIKLSSDGTDLRPTMVRVRRQIEESTRKPGVDTRIKHQKIRHSLSYLYGGSAQTFKVLLVVARDLSRDPDPWSPTVVQAAVLKMREKYLDHGTGPQIVVKVVRPGSLERFEEILESDTLHVVHFDMHGGTSETANQAQLLFNENSNSYLTERWISGDKIAPIVKKHKIRCVVIGACQSARTDSVAHANLAWSFLSEKVENVLAMSFKIVDTMSQKFFDAFYLAFFVQRREFSEAAHFARSEIFRDPQRWYYNGCRWEMLIDWFVPVVYSDGSPFFAINRRGLILHSLWSSGGFVAFLTSIGMLFLFQLQLVGCWWRLLRRSKQNELFDALDVSMTDKWNVLRLEHDLCRAKSVFFNCIYEGGTGNGLKKLLHPLLKIWERTHLVDGSVILDSNCFRQRYCLKRSYSVWRIWFWRIWTRRKPRDHEPHLLVVIQGVEKLFSNRTDEELKDGRSRLKSWIDDNFGTLSLDHPEAFSPYLIMVGAAKAGISRDQRVPETEAWIRANLGQVRALQCMAANVFEPTAEELSIQTIAQYIELGMVRERELKSRPRARRLV